MPSVGQQAWQYASLPLDFSANEMGGDLPHPSLDPAHIKERLSLHPNQDYTTQPL